MACHVGTSHHLVILLMEDRTKAHAPERVADVNKKCGAKFQRRSYQKNPGNWTSLSLSRSILKVEANCRIFWVLSSFKGTPD